MYTYGFGIIVSEELIKGRPTENCSTHIYLVVLMIEIMALIPIYNLVNSFKSCRLCSYLPNECYNIENMNRSERSKFYVKSLEIDHSYLTTEQ